MNGTLSKSPCTHRPSSSQLALAISLLTSSMAATACGGPYATSTENAGEVALEDTSPTNDDSNGAGQMSAAGKMTTAGNVDSGSSEGNGGEAGSGESVEAGGGGITADTEIASGAFSITAVKSGGGGAFVFWGGSGLLVSWSDDGLSWSEATPILGDATYGHDLFIKTNRTGHALVRLGGRCALRSPEGTWEEWMNVTCEQPDWNPELLPNGHIISASSSGRIVSVERWDPSESDFLAGFEYTSLADEMDVVGEPELTVSMDGRAAVTWFSRAPQDDGLYGYLAYYDGSSWSEPTRIQHRFDDSWSDEYMRHAFYDDGVAVAWVSRDVWVADFAPDQGWSEGDQLAGGLKVDLYASGDGALVVRAARQVGGMFQVLFYERPDPQTPLPSEPLVFSEESLGRIDLAPEVFIDADGNAFVLHSKPADDTGVGSRYGVVRYRSAGDGKWREIAQVSQPGNLGGEEMCLLQDGQPLAVVVVKSPDELDPTDSSSYLGPLIARLIATP